jgi:hypothetical protein
MTWKDREPVTPHDVESLKYLERKPFTFLRSYFALFKTIKVGGRGCRNNHKLLNWF